MKQAYYIDTFSTGHLHEMFNVASLEMFANMYDHIEYRTSRSSYQHVKAFRGELPSNVSVAFIPTISVHRGWRKFRFLFKQLQAVLHNAYYILTIPKGYDIIFNYNTLAALPIMNRLIAHCDNRVLQICHGEMIELVQPMSKNVFLRNGLKVFRQPITIATNLYFAVLGKSIYDNIMSQLSSSSRQKLLYFEHPIVCTESPRNTTLLQDKLIVGLIGDMRASKGLDALVELAHRLKRKKNVELRCIGNLNLPDHVIQESEIVMANTDTRHYLTRQEMYMYIKELDYALFLLPPERYQYMASGTVFDAIVCGIPILSLTNDYFAGLFASYGEFGYLEKDLDTLSQRIDWLVNQGMNRPVWDLQYLLQALSPQKIAEQFEKQWLV